MSEPNMPETNMSEWQRKWFATGKANFEKRTGKSMDEWVAIARTCPETGHRARLKWFKDNHGLLLNSASWVLSQAFGTGGGWSDPKALREALWTDPASTAILQAVEAMVTSLAEVSQGQRKGYSAWSHKVQFVAIRPVKGGTAMLGLALDPAASPRLEPPRNESWSERLKARTALASPAAVDAELKALIRQAWERS